MSLRSGEIPYDPKRAVPSSLGRPKLTFALGGTILLLLAAHTWAIPPVVQLADVPVDRLVANLDRQASRDPNDFQTRFNLARAHALAYALKTDTLQVHKSGGYDDVWFGLMAGNLPCYVAPTRDVIRLKEAGEHLDKALRRYEEALKLKPEHLAARLGHAWAVEQSSDKVKAIACYRGLIKDAWSQEKDLKEPPPGWHPVTIEASTYLMALLDRANDKDEIDVLQARINGLPAWWFHPPRSPVVAPLRDGLGVEELIDRVARVAFDADGTGLKKGWTWVTRDAGWLVFDPRGSGSITSATQMFGAASFGMCWDDGYQALGSLDDDGDGTLTGKELDGLAIWRDGNGNGACEPGEMAPLATWGIVAISCRADQGAIPAGCAAFARSGMLLRGGKTRPTYDILLYQASRRSGQPIQRPGVPEKPGP